MRNERINARFFCIFDVFMRSKSHFFAVYPQFWRPFWRPHFNIVFPFMIKALQESFLEELFCYLLEFKFHQIHLLFHELIREVCIYSSYQSFRTIPHPSIYDIRTNVLHASGCVSMPKEILSYFTVFQFFLKLAIQRLKDTVCITVLKVLQFCENLVLPHSIFIDKHLLL